MRPQAPNASQILEAARKMARAGNKNRWRAILSRAFPEAPARPDRARRCVGYSTLSALSVLPNRGLWKEWKARNIWEVLSGLHTCGPGRGEPGRAPPSSRGCCLVVIVGHPPRPRLLVRKSSTFLRQRHGAPRLTWPDRTLRCLGRSALSIL